MSLPDLGTAQTVTQHQLMAVAVALGLDPNTIGWIRIDADAVTLGEWDEVARDVRTRVVPVRTAAGPVLNLPLAPVNNPQRPQQNQGRRKA